MHLKQENLIELHLILFDMEDSKNINILDSTMSKLMSDTVYVTEQTLSSKIVSLTSTSYFVYK